MPKYVYQGLETGLTFELEQRISDPALTENPETGEPVKRLIGRPAIAFKGSGFYANDARGGSSGDASPKSESSAAKTEAPAPKAEASGEAKPAASPAKD